MRYRTEDINPFSELKVVFGPRSKIVKAERIQTTGACPVCKKGGSWRSGVGFEHEMRCGKCQLVWEPDREMILITLED